MSLRARLLLGFVAIALVLLAADVVLVVTVSRSLVDQIDQRLEQASGPFNRGIQGSFPGPNRVGPPTSGSSSPTTNDSQSSTTNPEESTRPALTEFFFVVLGPDGSVLTQQLPSLRDGDPAPAIDGQKAIERAVPAGRPLAPYTVGSEGGSGLRYRVAVQRTTDGNYAMVGIPLSEADATLSRLIWVEVAATAAVLLVLGLVAFWVIRLGLRPIERMTATADAIAEGDLSKRVEAGPSSTEAGRLGLALNGMLHQIEGAFDERQASEDRLRRFIADASHELRTPLTSIRGYTELYRSGVVSEGEGLADAMRRIEGESVRMGGLVDDMLLLARLDQGRPLDSKPVDLAALARDSASDAHAVEPDRPITLDVPSTPVVVAGDEQRLRQVLANLLANARQHTSPDTPVLVKVSTEGSRAVVEVADRGPGVPSGDAERIFERFYRADPSRTRRDGVDGGAGLGLSIVAAVAAAHHGQASVETAPGHGCRFLVELPLASTPAPTRAATPTTA
jgi:two-component system OmpR family sensor kinase